MEIVVLGTASMVPTKERNLTSVFLSYENKGILFDCGEGTQRQMKIAGIKPNRINKILISHWHGDHVLGLPGLLQTLGNSNYEGTLELYGPKGTRKYFKSMIEGFAFDTPLDIKVHDIEEGMFFENEDFYLESRKLSHGILTHGYAFIEKDKRKMIKSRIEKIPGLAVGKLQKGMSVVVQGKKITPDMVSSIKKGRKIAFVTDTEPCNGALEISHDADVLLCEATFLSDLEEKGRDYKHMTAAQAAHLATNANVRKLVLCHFSGRYKTTNDLEEEARTIFPETDAAYDFWKMKL